MSPAALTKSATIRARSSGDAAAVAGSAWSLSAEPPSAKPANSGSAGASRAASRARSTSASTALGVDSSGADLRDLALSDGDRQRDSGDVLADVLVDAAVGEAGQRRGAHCRRGQRLSAITDQREHALTGVGGLPRRGLVENNHQWTPTRTSRKRQGTAWWPVWPTCIGWPLPQWGTPKTLHSSCPPTASMEAQNVGPIPV